MLAIAANVEIVVGPTIGFVVGTSSCSITTTIKKVPVVSFYKHLFLKAY